MSEDASPPAAGVTFICPHEWVLPGILMPEGYWKPTGPITCRWCGAWQHVQMTTRIIPGPIADSSQRWVTSQKGSGDV